MRIRVVPIRDWSVALDKARATVGKQPLGKEPSLGFKQFMLLAEHSPIREMAYDIQMDGVPSWVATHFIRHSIGAGTPYISTQRSDRNPDIKNRNAAPQGNPVVYHQTRNAQSIINVSRKRMCSKASKETRMIWKSVVNKIGDIDPVLASKCVPECLYRGFCPEKESCGFDRSPVFEEQLIEYRKK